MENITTLDKNMVLALSKYRARNLTTLMKLATKLGDGYVWGALCIFIAFINFNAGLAMMIASVLQVILQQIIKHTFTRARPYIAHDDIFYIIPPPDKFSFPSGHTAGAFVMVFALFHFYPAFFGVMLAVACIIAFSRVYLGLHYPTDILGGIVLGYLSYFGGIEIVNMLLKYSIIRI